MGASPSPAVRGEEGAAALLVVRLLGPWEAQVHGQPLPPLRSRKGEWLLALLLLQKGGALERDWLAGLFWPESTPSGSLFNLRRTLTDLRHALGPEADRLRAPTPRVLCFDATGAEVDLHRFDAAVARGDLPSLEAAVQWYRGPLLMGCAEEWIIPERTAREQAYLGALERLAGEARARGDGEAAARALRRTVAADPLRESAQHALMEALATGGDVLAATLVFRDYRLLLHRETGTAPGPEITAFFQQLRAQVRARSRPGASARRRSGASTEAPGGLPPIHRVPPALLQGSKAGARGQGPGVREASALTPDPRPLTPTFHLPRPVSSFVGRVRELPEIEAALATARLVTLTGPGGVGKTRLALRVGEQLLPDYPDGVWFVELAGLAAGADLPLIAQTAARVLEVGEPSDRPLLAALQAFLRPKRLLLILDNCEHLLAACDPLVAALLESAPELRVLATSRQSLGLAGEVDWRVPSLSLPALVDSGWWLGRVR